VSRRAQRVGLGSGRHPRDLGGAACAGSEMRAVAALAAALSRRELRSSGRVRSSARDSSVAERRRGGVGLARSRLDRRRPTSCRARVLDPLLEPRDAEAQPSFLFLRIVQARAQVRAIPPCRRGRRRASRSAPWASWYSCWAERSLLSAA
jgi:hypothetical protein